MSGGEGADAVGDRPPPGQTPPGHNSPSVLPYMGRLRPGLRLVSRIGPVVRVSTAAQSQTMWGVIRPVQAVTGDIFIQIVRPQRSANCF